jgi:hypothetical protein
MKNNTADYETSFYIRLKTPLFMRRRLRPECPCSIPYGAAALQASLVRGAPGAQRYPKCLAASAEIL